MCREILSRAFTPWFTTGVCLKACCLALVVPIGSLTAGQQVPAYEELEGVRDGGVVHGVVRFVGEPPPAKTVPVTKNPEVCGEGDRLVEEVKVSDGALQNVVVYLEGVEAGKGWSIPDDGVLLDQQECRFTPQVVVLPKGEPLVIQNSDPVLHNIHARETFGRVHRTIFNIAQPDQGSRLTQRVRPRRSNLVEVECDAHEFMHAWMLVVANPYYAKVDQAGAFSIAEVPPGTYLVKAWHPTLGTQEQEVTIAPNGTMEVAITFQ